MKRKRLVIFLVVAIVIIAGFSMYHARVNYNYGGKLFNAANSMSIQTKALADSIAYLEETLTCTSNEEDDIYRHSFDFAMSSLRSSFGYDDIPLTEEVRSAWINRFEKLYAETNEDSELHSLFADPDKYTELKLLQYQLTDLTVKLSYLSQRYQQMSVIERYTFSWRKEVQFLSKSVNVEFS